MTLRLAVVAVVMVGCSKDTEEYIRKSKSIEAKLMLDKVSKGAKRYQLEHDAFPTGTAGPTPARTCCEPGPKCEPDLALWEASPWRELEVVVDLPHYFRYTYQSDGKTFTATAIGDLDCDGSVITYEITGTADGQLSPITARGND